MRLGGGWGHKLWCALIRKSQTQGHAIWGNWDSALICNRLNDLIINFHNIFTEHRNSSLHSGWSGE